LAGRMLRTQMLRIADHYDMSAERRNRKGRGPVPVAGRMLRTQMLRIADQYDMSSERRIRKGGTQTTLMLCIADQE